jgi:hypothetical protein
MIHKKCAKEYTIEKMNKHAVDYPYCEKLLFDNHSVAIVTHETESTIRIGLIHNN